jgi:alpha-1,3-rhamnosyl/mannosyltransferase
MKSLRDWKLVIVGKRGWLYDSILKQANSLDIPVSFLDYVPASDLPALVSGARLFVFPSLHEGFGLPILEAQACGVPVVCSRSSSLPEAAGEAAILFDPLDVDAMADAIRRGLSDEGWRAEMISRGFENVKRFSWERSARQVYDVLMREMNR